jgi:8-oxo-dGTP diphosphatase
LEYGRGPARGPIKSILDSSDPSTHDTASRRLADIDWAQWRAHDRATLVFVIEGRRILLIRKKRGLGAGKINGPGGKLDPGETPRDCAQREVEEELCATPIGLVARGELRFQFTDGYSIHVYVFVASGLAGNAQETDEAIPIWTPVEAVPYDEMWADDRLWLPGVMAGASTAASSSKATACSTTRCFQSTRRRAYHSTSVLCPMRRRLPSGSSTLNSRICQGRVSSSAVILAPASQQAANTDSTSLTRMQVTKPGRSTAVRRRKSSRVST